MFLKKLGKLKELQQKLETDTVRPRTLYSCHKTCKLAQRSVKVIELKMSTARGCIFWGSKAFLGWFG